MYLSYIIIIIILKLITKINGIKLLYLITVPLLFMIFFNIYAELI
jgi:hypothetical protein